MRQLTRSFAAVVVVIVLMALVFLFAQKIQRDSDSIESLMMKRYTVRTFDSTLSVDSRHIEKILAVGKLAPSKNSLWPYQIVVLTDSQRGNELKQLVWEKYTGCFNCLVDDGRKVAQKIHSIKTAPLNILFFLTPKPEDYDYEKDGTLKKDFINASSVRASRDAMISATAMMLQAEQLGYGTAFTGAFSADSYFNKMVGLTEDAESFLVLSIGKPMPVKKTWPENHSEIYLDSNCNGSKSHFIHHIVLERYSDGLPKVTTRAMDVGPDHKKQNTSLIKSF